MDKNTRIFITGATGFIGRFLIEELRAKGYMNITALARKTSNTGFLKSRGVNIVIGDITDRSSFEDIPGVYDVVFHCAASLNDGNERELKAANIQGTENICRWALKHKAGKLIYTSSIAVNSGNTEIPLTEDKPYKPNTRYGISKISAEKIAIGFRKAGLPLVIVRPCMVYGEEEPHAMRFLTTIMRLRLFFIPDRGKTKWHLVSARNVAACLLHCMEDARALGGTFMIADKEVFTVRQVIGLLARGLKLPEPPLLPHFLTRLLMLVPVLGWRLRLFCKDRVYSIERLKTVLDFTPPYEAAGQLIRAAESFR